MKGVLIADPVCLAEGAITTIVSCITGSIFFSTQDFPRDGLQPTSYVSIHLIDIRFFTVLGRPPFEVMRLDCWSTGRRPKKSVMGLQNKVRDEDGEGSVPGGWWWLPFGGTRCHDVTGQINKGASVSSVAIRSKKYRYFCNKT